jgi:hypothetical protein
MRAAVMLECEAAVRSTLTCETQCVTVAQVLLMAFGAAELAFGMLVASMFSRAKLAAVAGLLLHFCMLLPRYVFFRTGRSPADDFPSVSQCNLALMPGHKFDCVVWTVQGSLKFFLPRGLHRCQLPLPSHLVRICLLSTRAPALAPLGAPCLQTPCPWQPSLGASLVVC